MNDEKLIVILNEIYFSISRIVERCAYLDKRLKKIEKENLTKSDRITWNY